uniref:TNFR-Cys domain-containing protein n=1 Tax=Esox lucius TaxID=8010 RepID=A0A3P9A0W5_ESOLU
MLFSATVSSVTMFLAILLTFHNVDLSPACGPTEYRKIVECFPGKDHLCILYGLLLRNICWYQYTNNILTYCSTGDSVSENCREYRRPPCVSCFNSNFFERSVHLLCIPCTQCDPGFGLRVKHPCRPSSDTVCEPLEGFYCTDPTKDGCKSAQRHSRCKPGQYIRQNGTTSKDTVCVDCTGDTYSDGSFTSCQPHKM